MQKIITHIWFNDQAEQAVEFYLSVFNNSRVLITSYYGQASEQVSGRAAGSVMSIHFELEGQEFIALNGGPHFTLNPAISLVVNCDSQAEIDRLWQQLGEGGQHLQCGCLTDRFGLSWQIIPSDVVRFMLGPDNARNERVMQALLKMQKLDIAVLKAAYQNH